MTFSYIDARDNVSLPEPMKNAGLYSGDIPSKKTRWAKDYTQEHAPPDAVKYSAHFFELARSHIPTNVRPGNNAIIDDAFVVNDDKYNTLCFNKA